MPGLNIVKRVENGERTWAKREDRQLLLVLKDQADEQHDGLKYVRREQMYNKLRDVIK
jgi:hypothetical protein